VGGWLHHVAAPPIAESPALAGSPRPDSAADRR